ncbi:hypothetical protein CSUI_002894 [Cystoisospora suis]|uniref:Uncharacterized protein n=1 Tax=Cystoisospora suis TaxID=483139 RepID=A0A2C6L7A9_9APIC|nr:hypothetical protein CSUI_002894 [Cystoisospora suis]
MSTQRRKRLSCPSVTSYPLFLPFFVSLDLFASVRLHNALISRRLKECRWLISPPLFDSSPISPIPSSSHFRYDIARPPAICRSLFFSFRCVCAVDVPAVLR